MEEDFLGDLEVVIMGILASAHARLMEGATRDEAAVAIRAVASDELMEEDKVTAEAISSLAEYYMDFFESNFFEHDEDEVDYRFLIALAILHHQVETE